MGSLIAALASYLDARSQQGIWLLRIDDIDPPREAAGATDSILRSLEQHGLYWDESVIYQSQRNDHYRAALAQLQAQVSDVSVFACTCNRVELAAGGVCRGLCLTAGSQTGQPHALRITVPDDHEVRFEDAVQGPQRWRLGKDVANFVIRRKDGLWAYQLAAAVDDTDHGITHVVRGSDLLDSTPRQIYLQQLLGKAPPNYCHLPVITNQGGQKLSKQNCAPALDDAAVVQNLRTALQFLGQATAPRELQQVDELLSFATTAWQLAHIPAQLARPAADVGINA